MVIAAYNVSVLVSLARQAGGVIIMSYAVGDTLFEGDTLLSPIWWPIRAPRSSSEPGRRATDGAHV